MPARIPPPQSKDLPAGALTAGIFDDNLSIEFFKSYHGRLLETQAAGLPSFTLAAHEADEYLTQKVPFTDDLEQFRATLVGHQYAGGSDFPEAPDAGLAEANQLQWRTGADVARILFWPADAPHHVEKAAAMKSSIEASQDQEVHIYPIASSGIDEFPEFTMRASAQLTLRRYMFLTDNSGLGARRRLRHSPQW